MPYISLKAFSHLHGIQSFITSMLLWNVILDLNDFHRGEHDRSCYCSHECLFKDKKISLAGQIQVLTESSVFLYLRF